LLQNTELKVARTIVSLALFSTVALLAGAMTVGALSFTADTVAHVAALTPVKTQKRLPSYVAYMPTVKAEVLNIAKSVPVATRVPKTPVPLTETLPAPTFTHIVAVEALRVRSGPRVSYPKLFSLKGGTQVVAQQKQGTWVKVDAGQGRVGWVAAKLLRSSAAQ